MLLLETWVAGVADAMIKAALNARLLQRDSDVKTLKHYNPIAPKRFNVTTLQLSTELKIFLTIFIPNIYRYDAVSP